jgi:hypothetical protein
MTLREELDHWRAEEGRLAVARAAAWDRDPGNHGMVHNFYGPHGFHTAFTAWAAARDRVRELEKKLGAEEAA